MIYKKDSLFEMVCQNCQRKRILTYKAYWYVKSKYSKGFCKKCSPTNITGLKLGHGWNKGLNGFGKGHKPYYIAIGKDNPSWKGGITPINAKIRNSKEYILWRTAVFVRDSYTCQICNQKGGELQADHIKPFSLFPELRLAIDNGRTLCKECHKQTDTYAGRSINYGNHI